MNIDNYQKEAMKFLNPKLVDKDVLINSVMGLCGEAGETIDIVKKHFLNELSRDDADQFKYINFHADQHGILGCRDRKSGRPRECRYHVPLRPHVSVRAEGWVQRRGVQAGAGADAGL